MEKYEAGLYTFVEERYAQLLSDIGEKNEITDEIDKQLQEALTAYNDEFKDTIK